MFYATVNAFLRGRRGGAVAAIVAGWLVLGAFLLLAAPADAGKRNYRVGVVPGVLPTQAELNSMRRDRAKSMRVVFSWEAMEVVPPRGACATAVYNFDRYDDLVRQAGRRGIKLLPVFLGSPKYAAGGGKGKARTQYPRAGTRGMENYKCWVRAVVNRYGNGGSFGAADITEWQAWNEVNLPIYNPNSQVDPRKYAKYLKANKNAVRSADRRAIIVLAGLPEESFRGLSWHTFVRKMYRVKGARSAYDVAALHPYAENHRGVKGAIVRTRRTLRQLNDGGRPLWLTEVGWASTGKFMSHELITNEKGQAERLTRTFQMIRRNKRRYKIGTVHWFRYRDLSSLSEARRKTWPDFAGLYRKNGTPKPACRRYRRVTGAPGGCVRIGGASSTSASSAEDASLLDVVPDSQLIPSAPR